jgi:Xaa-Pro aminopeptidase
MSRSIPPGPAESRRLQPVPRRPVEIRRQSLTHPRVVGVEPGRVVRTEHGRIDQPPVDRPQRIAKTGTVALKPGMILSNEPGYYRSRAYGIRIENLILVEARMIPAPTPWPVPWS